MSRKQSLATRLRRKHDEQTSAAWLAAFVQVILESELGVKVEGGKVKAA